MGYELKLIVVESSHRLQGDQCCGDVQDMYYGRVIATIDLCKCDDFSDYFTEYTDIYFYAPCGDGNTPVWQDRYGDRLRQCTDLQGLINKLNELYDDTGYRRYQAAASMLIPYMHTDIWPNVYVLCFGH